MESMRIELRNYKTGVIIPCGSAAAASGRVKFTVFATNDIPMALDFHIHHESPSSTSNGPDQDGNSSNRRLWEGGFHDVSIPGGNLEAAVTTQTANGTPVGLNVFHIGQLAATTENSTKVGNEIFCSFTNLG